MRITVHDRSANHARVVDACTCTSASPYKVPGTRWPSATAEMTFQSPAAVGRVCSTRRAPNAKDAACACDDHSSEKGGDARPKKGDGPPPGATSKLTAPKVKEGGEPKGNVLPNQPKGEGAVLNSIIEQLGSGPIGASTFVGVVDSITYYDNPHLFPWPSRYVPPASEPPCELDEYCVPPKINAPDCTDDPKPAECDCLEVLDFVPRNIQQGTVESSLFLGFIPVYELQTAPFTVFSDDASFSDLESFVAVAWNLLLDNQDIVEWLLCLVGSYLGGKQECISVTDLMNADEPQLAISFDGLSGQNEPHAASVDVEIEENGTLNQVVVIDTDSTRWQYLTSYWDGIRDNYFAPDEIVQSALVCIVAQVAADLLSALVTGCMKDVDDCPDIRAMVENSFMWAIAQRYPCMNGDICSTISDDLWMSPTPSLL